MLLQFHLVARIDSLLPFQLFHQVRSLAHEGGHLGPPRRVDLQVRHLLIHRRRLHGRADGDDLIGVDALVRFLAAAVLFGQGLDCWNSRAATDEHNLVQVLCRH
mmetsp:Transcript_75125/g.215185  ORF Transcript_75125/g.215185 Transcript_75125/m.215185 type:complete len:104 (-) Transcript_75125:1446-1757(-)